MSPSQYRRSNSADISIMLRIENAMREKAIRNQELQKALGDRKW